LQVKTYSSNLLRFPVKKEFFFEEEKRRLHAQAQQRFSMWHCIVAFDISNKFLSSWLKTR
jgi:hypothetical protein